MITLMYCFASHISDERQRDHFQCDQECHIFLFSNIHKTETMQKE